MAEVNT